MNNFIKITTAFCLLSLAVSNGRAEETGGQLVPSTSQVLTLQQVFQRAVDRYPLLNQLPALEQEAVALKKWGDSLVAGVPSFSFRIQGDHIQNNTGLVEYEAGVDLPLWRWGQRQASQKMARSVSSYVGAQSKLLHYNVASLLRSTIWNLKLKLNELNFAKNNVVLISKLVRTVRRRVELGDLARTDLLLAESEFKARQARVEEISFEVETAKQDYLMLTGLTETPQFSEELLSKEHYISDEHPLLVVQQSRVTQLEAKLNWERHAGAGQPILTLGVRSEKADRRSDTVDSMGIAINLPFSGRAHRGREIAAINSQLMEAVSQLELLKRELKRDFRKVQQQIKTDRKKEKLTEARREITQKHLAMSQIGFEVGEISLIDMLKIQENGQQALLNASRQQIIMQRNIARFNQITGRLP